MFFRILDTLATTLNENFDNKLSVLLMAEMESVRDPTTSFQSAQAISSINADVYVLDYSIGVVPGTLFKTLTSNKPNHIVNGTGLSTHELLEKFIPTLIADLNAGNC